MKRYLKTLIAVILLVGMWAGFNYYNLHKSQQPVATPEKPKDLILPVKAEQVQSFTITPKGGEAFTCARDGKNWSITAPHRLSADSSAASDYATALAGLEPTAVADPHPANLKDFGLDPPASVINVTTSANPSQVTLMLGDSTPTSDGIYAQVAGNSRVITLGSYQKTSLEKTVFDLRDKRVLTLDSDQIQRLDVTSKGKTFTLTKNPEGFWDLLLPPAVRADNFGVQNLLSGLGTTNMASIVKEDKSGSGAYGFGQPTLTIKFTTPAGSQTIVVGKKDGDHYDAMNSALAPVFALGADFVTRYQVDPATLRDKGLFSFSNFDAKTLDITTPKEHRVFEQKDFKWKQTSPAAKDESTEKMEDLLNALTDIKAASFPNEKPGSLAAFGLDKPLYTVKVTFGEKNQTEIVVAGGVNDHYYAARSTDTVPAEISKTALDAVDKALSAL